MLRASSVVGEAPREAQASVKQQPKRAEIWAALAIVYVVWGSTYLGIKLAVRTLPPVLTAGTRFLVASALLSLVLALMRRSLRVTAREPLGASVLGVMLLGAGVGMVHGAEQRVD